MVAKDVALINVDMEYIYAELNTLRLRLAQRWEVFGDFERVRIMS